MIQGKVWGTTEPLLITPLIEVHRIWVDPQRQCSQHHHQHKHNMFYVICGTLEILVHKNDYNLIDRTVLNDGEFTVVPPTEVHQFKSINKVTEALEIYFIEPINPRDIIRKTVGGILEDV